MYNIGFCGSQFFPMELALTIISGLGALLFVVSFLLYVASGFKHHFVTGIISALPVLNIVTLPSLWHKSKGNFIVGLFGLIIAGGGWFMGANTGFQKLLSGRLQSSPETVVISAKPNQPVSESTVAATQPIVNQATPIKPKRSSTLDESKMQGLPTKALYSMSFDSVPVDKIATLEGKIVQVTHTDNAVIEGRIKNVAAGTVIIEGTLEKEIPIATIKQLKLMVKKANQ